MKKTRFNILGDFLPLPIRMLGGVFLFVGLIASGSEQPPLIVNGLYFLGLFFLFSRSGTFLDTKRKIIFRYFTIIFLPMGIFRRYELLTCFWLKAHRMQAVWQN